MPTTHLFTLYAHAQWVIGLHLLLFMTEKTLDEINAAHNRWLGIIALSVGTDVSFRTDNYMRGVFGNVRSRSAAGEIFGKRAMGVCFG